MSTTYTPLRYPGGKSQLYRFIENLLVLNEITDGVYVEPFSGGAGIAVQLLQKNKVESIIINDFDPSIHAIWFAILNQTKEFVDLIENTDITINEWNKQKVIYQEVHNEPSSLQNAFATFFLNRTNRSGIIQAGPIGGKEQSGTYKIDCRFNKANLIKKICKIAELKKRISLFNLDATDFIKDTISNMEEKKTFCFFDPPYFLKGQSLYTNFFTPEKHKELHDEIVKLDDFFWITTYDHIEDIAEIYKDTEIFEYSLNYFAQKKRIEKEYLFTNGKTKLESFANVSLEQVNDLENAI